ncbi:hypothetical protein VTK26DRAFT_3490 [Humicola hyalothermophila]
MRPVVDHETDKDSHTSTMKETIQSNPPTSVKVGMKRKADDLGSPEPKRPKSAPVNPIKTGSPAADETTDSAALATAHSKRKLEDDAPEPIPAKRIKIKVIKFSQSNSSGDEEENEPPATPAASEASDDTDFVPDRFLTVRDSLSPSRLSSDSDDDASLMECSMSIVSSDDDESVILPLPTAEPKSDSNNNNNTSSSTTASPSARPSSSPATEPTPSSPRSWTPWRACGTSTTLRAGASGAGWCGRWR